MDNHNYLNITMPQRSEIIYKISQTTLNTFLTDLTAGTISGYNLTNFFTEMSSYVTKIIYFPVDTTKFANWLPTGTSIVMGNKSFSYSNNELQYMYTYVKYFEFSPSRQFNNFLDFAPYTKYHLYIPYFPLIDLDPQIIYGHTVECYLSLDFRNGKFKCYIYIDNTELIESKETNIGIEISVGKSNEDDIRRNNVLQSISMLGSLITMGVGVATENPLAIGAGVGMVTKNVTTAIANNVSRLTGYNGGNGSITELSVDKNPKIIIERPQNVISPSLSLKGAPCRKNLALSGVSGYTEIGQINFNPNGADIYNDELNEIIDLLHAGVIL